jgi:CYTH domain-containing protein/predicted ATPase
MDEMEPRIYVVALTGGPCGGKTTFFTKAREWLENRGCVVATVPEAATELMQNGLAPWAKWNQPVDFQRELIMYILKRETAYMQFLLSLNTDRPLVLLCDRGALDGRAYIDEISFQEMLEELDLGIGTLMNRYDLVIHMVTAAIGAEEHYTLENNPARTESDLELARSLDRKTLLAWTGHPHHRVIDNSTGFHHKIGRALKTFSRILPVPEPRERERKYVVDNFSMELVPHGAVRSHIIQHYLVNESAGELRVRARTTYDITKYTVTEKRPTDDHGERIETERECQKEEYEKLLTLHDLSTAPIEKERFTFPCGSHQMELDIYIGHSSRFGKVILEVEVGSMDEAVELPTGWVCKDVTGIQEYSNRGIAQQLVEVMNPDK